MLDITEVSSYLIWLLLLSADPPPLPKNVRNLVLTPTHPNDTVMPHIAWERPEALPITNDVCICALFHKSQGSIQTIDKKWTYIVGGNLMNTWIFLQFSFSESETKIVFFDRIISKRPWNFIFFLNCPISLRNPKVSCPVIIFYFPPSDL